MELASVKKEIKILSGVVINENDGTFIDITYQLGRSMDIVEEKYMSYCNFIDNKWDTEEQAIERLEDVLFPDPLRATRTELRGNPSLVRIEEIIDTVRQRYYNASKHETRLNRDIRVKLSSQPTKAHIYGQKKEKRRWKKRRHQRTSLEYLVDDIDQIFHNFGIDPNSKISEYTVDEATQKTHALNTNRQLRIQAYEIPAIRELEYQDYAILNECRNELKRRLTVLLNGKSKAKKQRRKLNFDMFSL